MDGGGGKSNQIFCLTWVKRGAAKTIPDQITLTTDELKGVIGNKGSVAVEEDGDSWEDLDDSEGENSPQEDGDKIRDGKESLTDQEDDLAEYDLENYDDDEGDTSGVGGLVMFSDNNEDPYITKKRKSGDEESSDSEEEEEEKISIKIQPDDNLLVCARCGQHSSVLEVYVYNHKSEDFFVHHDIPLTETPLCMQWLGYDPGVQENCQGSLLAVGNYNSTIDIWDLDVLNTLEPVISIGNKTKKSSKKRKNTAFAHNDAILDLAWTEILKDQLASASADTVVALWDLEFGKCIRTFRDHKNKVQTIEWKPRSDGNLISGAFDGSVILFNSTTSKSVADWSLNGEVERITWNYGCENYFCASMDNGLVYYLDIRKPRSYLHKWKAHESAIPGLSIMSKSGEESSCLLYTASSDGFVKMWDVSQNGPNPKLVHAKNMKMGMVHCCQINPDEKYVVASGGQKDSIRLWDVTKTAETTRYLGLSSDIASGENDTLNPLGGSIEDDVEVVKYFEGEDYIDEAKLKKIAKQNQGKTLGARNNTGKSESIGTNGISNKNTGTLSDSAKKAKKRRNRKKRRQNVVQGSQASAAS